jgi:hypothetical protein
MMLITKNTVAKRIGDIVTAEIEGKTVFMSIEAGNYYALDEVGARIWEIIENQTTVGQIIDILGSEFEVSPEVCENDTKLFLQQLLDEKLIKVE